MAAAIAITVFLGFAPTYYLRPADAPLLTTITHVHGVAFTLWIVWFAAQVSLVAVGRRDFHRRVGLAGAGLAVAMVVLGWMVAIAAARREILAGQGDEALAFLIVPLGDVITFAVLIAAGLWYRPTAGLHRRLMLLATLAILPAAIGRMPGFDAPVLFVPYYLALVMAQPIHDWWLSGRPHPLSLWGGLAIVVSVVARFFAQHSAWWLAIAERLV
jgi:hypothetical protein